MLIGQLVAESSLYQFASFMRKYCKNVGLVQVNIFENFNCFNLSALKRTPATTSSNPLVVRTWNFYSQLVKITSGTDAIMRSAMKKLVTSWQEGDTWSVGEMFPKGHLVAKNADLYGIEWMADLSDADTPRRDSHPSRQRPQPSPLLGNGKTAQSAGRNKGATHGNTRKKSAKTFHCAAGLLKFT